ncbi:MAG: peroxiredoxin [Acidiphilium sp.]|nr:peroxiredoxin [Acidiphilium sp.]MDD4934300.1 peroxiredoxin [Acidiphilium sp.]
MIKVGDKLPAMKLMTPGTEGPQEVDTGELFAAKTVVLFAVPGAFTPTCSAKHLPGFLEQYDALKAKGVDAIVCLAVNDVFVMGAWAASQSAGDKIIFLADGSAMFTRALGLELDLVTRGLGVRSQRFALIAKDGIVTYLAVEQAGGFEVSRAESILEVLSA